MDDDAKSETKKTIRNLLCDIRDGKPGIGRGPDLSTIEGCAKALGPAVYSVYWGSVFSDVSFTGDGEGRHQRMAKHAADLARLYVPLKKLYEALVENPPNPISGFAVVDSDGNVVKNGRGLVILETIKEVEDLIEFWKRDAGTPRLEQIATLSIRPCVVSVQDGLTFVEPDTLP
jgi:hypothetical protein